MRLLIDTNIFLWSLQDDKKLTKNAKITLENANEVYVSSASIWEIAIKKDIGKIEVDVEQLAEAISAAGFIELPITAKHASTILTLKNIHRDPFDRLLIAQAISEPLILLTSDKLLKDYSSLVHLI